MYHEKDHCPPGNRIVCATHTGRGAGQRFTAPAQSMDEGQVWANGALAIAQFRQN